MTTKQDTIKPATPLPWLVSDLDVFIGKVAIVDTQGLGVARVNRNFAPKGAEQNAAYIVAAANAYPQLVAERAELVAALRSITMQGCSQGCPEYTAADGTWERVQHTPACKKASALLLKIEGGEK